MMNCHGLVLFCLLVEDPGSKPPGSQEHFRFGMSDGIGKFRALGHMPLFPLGSATDVTKQCNLVPAKWGGVIYLAGKVIAGLVESNGSLPPVL